MIRFRRGERARKAGGGEQQSFTSYGGDSQPGRTPLKNQDFVGYNVLDIRYWILTTAVDTGIT